MLSSSNTPGIAKLRSGSDVTHPRHDFYESRDHQNTNWSINNRRISNWAPIQGRCVSVIQIGEAFVLQKPTRFSIGFLRHTHCRVICCILLLRNNLTLREWHFSIYLDLCFSCLLLTLTSFIWHLFFRTATFDHFTFCFTNIHKRHTPPPRRIYPRCTN